MFRQNPFTFQNMSNNFEISNLLTDSVIVTHNSKNYTVHLLAVPNLTSDPWVIAAAWLYSLLFLLGFCGNSCVLVALFQMRQVLGKAQENIFIYIVVLSLVDLMVILSLPLAIAKMLFGHWVFGKVVCKSYWILESGGKVLSAFLLTGLSFDRYLAICKPSFIALRTQKAAAAILLITALVAVLLVCPIPYEATVTQISSKIMVLDDVPISMYYSECGTFKYDTEKQNQNFQSFTICIFIAVYLFPAICMGTFYICILRRISSHVQSTRVSSNVPVKRVTHHVAGLLVFHFCCWTPYWVLNLCQLIFQFSHMSDGMVLVMHFIHALPFLNSSLNWVFYAFLNSQFCTSHAASQTRSVAAAAQTDRIARFNANRNEASNVIEMQPLADEVL